MKYIDVQYHFVKDMVESMKVLLEKVDTLENVADSLKKSMRTKNFYCCREAMDISALIANLIKTLCPLYAKKTISVIMLGVCYIFCRV